MIDNNKKNNITPIGISWREKVDKINAVKDYKCEKDYPICIQSPHCGSDNRPLSKQATLIVLGEFINEISK